MAAKALVFLCAVAAAAAVAVPVLPSAKLAYAPASLAYAAAPVTKLSYAAPVAKLAYAAPVAKVAYAEPEAPAHYEFNYSVHDTQSGDIKQQHEQRAGESLQGSYSLVQPDGVHRVVDYTADDVHGFNAVVRYEGQATEAPAKIAYAAPVAKVAYAPAPVTYAAAPVAKLAYAPAPVSYAAAPVTKFAYAPAPVTYAAAPVTKVAYAPAPVAYAAAPAKIAYPASLGQVSFSSPAVSYHH